MRAPLRSRVVVGAETEAALGVPGVLPILFLQPAPLLCRRHDDGWIYDPKASGPGCRYCVCTATLVRPLVLPSEPVNCTKMRLVPGSKGIVPPPLTKMLKVGVASASIVVVTLGPAVSSH